MISLVVTATLRSQAHLGTKNTAANFLTGFSHIPGRAFLGAAAWAWLDEGRDASSTQFVQHYLSGDVSWGDLHPMPKDESGVVSGYELPVLVPRTVKTCKLFGLSHGLVDTLFDTPEHGCSYQFGDVACGVGRTRLEGVLVRNENGEWRAANVQRHHRAHVSVTPKTGTAQPGALYSREALQEGQVFRGEVLCKNDSVADQLAEALPKLRLAVGGGRSRGYGRLTVNIRRRVAPSLELQQVQRAADYIDARRPTPSGERQFTLTADSPWCLREPSGGFARALTPRWLAHALGLDAQQVRIVAGDARCAARPGWDGAAGLPTEVRHIVVAGSTFLCSTSGVDDETLTQRLSHLQQEGIGAHRVEGFGRVVVNHKLHFQLEEGR